MSPLLFLSQCRRVLVRAVRTGASLDFAPDCEGPALIGALEMHLGNMKLELMQSKTVLAALCRRVGVTEDEVAMRVAKGEWQ